MVDDKKEPEEIKTEFTFQTIADLLNANPDVVQKITNVLIDKDINVLDGTVLLLFIAISNAKSSLGVSKESIETFSGFIYEFSAEVEKKKAQEEAFLDLLKQAASEVNKLSN